MKLMVIDNHILFREGIVSLLKAQSDMEVVGESNIDEHAIQMVLAKRPDIVLLDVGTMHTEGCNLMKQVLSHLPDVSFIILATHDSDELFYEMISNGAKGYMLKNITKPILLASLRALDRGEAVIPRNRVNKVLSEFVRLGKVASNASREKDFSLLTYRELEVLKMLVNRATNREIANQLCISENTVRVHVSNILEKLKLRNRREASAFAKRIALTDSMLANKRQE